MNILNFFRNLKTKQNKFYADNPKAFWIHSTITLFASAWTFVKTVKTMNRKLDEIFSDILDTLLEGSSF